MEEPENLFSLKWIDFGVNLSEGFHDLLEENMMVDVTLAADGKFLQAHKLVLSVCSPYFKNLFKVNPCKHPIVILKDVSHNQLSDILQFMYKGEVGVRHDDLPSFLKLANTLEIKGLIGEKIETDSHEPTAKLNTLRVMKIKTKHSVGFKENVESSSQKNNSRNYKGVPKRRKKSLSCSKNYEKVNKKSKKCLVRGYNSVYTNTFCGSDGANSNKPFDNALLSLTSDENKVFNSSKYCEANSELDKYHSVKTHIGCMDFDSEDKLSEKEATDNDSIDDPGNFESPLSSRTANDSAEAEETPQGHLSSLIISRAPRAFVWDYFLKETHQAICLNCGKTFKGQRPNTICEQHLKRMHPEFYKILLEKKIKRAELHMNPVVMGLGIPTYDHD